MRTPSSTSDVVFAISVSGRMGVGVLLGFGVDEREVVSGKSRVGDRFGDPIQILIIFIIRL